MALEHVVGDTCLSCWLRVGAAGVVWFVPDVLGCFWKERKRAVGWEQGALAAGHITHGHWRRRRHRGGEAAEKG